MTTVNRRRPTELAEPKAPFVSRLANAMLYLAALTAAWTTVSVGGNNLVDYFLILALALLIFARLSRLRIVFVNGWMLAPLIASLLITVWAVAVGGSSSTEATMLLRVFLSTATVAVLLTSAAVDGGRPMLLKVLRFWTVGITISAGVAILTSFGIVDPSEVFVQKSGDRLSGLTSHPNGLAYSLVMGIPVVMYLVGAARSALRSVGWLGATAVIIWGLALTGSRAGLLVGLPVLALALILLMWSSRLRAGMVPIGIILAVLIANILPAVLADTRLVQGAEDSDSGRVRINEAAMQWFYDSPFFGGSFDAMHGVAVPIMVLSGGGIVLAVGYYLFLLRPIPVLFSGLSQPIAQMGALSIVAFLVFGVLNPVWMERLTYWPVLIAALVILLQREPAANGNPWSARRVSAGRTRRSHPRRAGRPQQAGMQELASPPADQSHRDSTDSQLGR